MRSLLLLGFLLYDVMAQAMKPSYDYDEMEDKRQAYEDRRNWRRKALLNQLEEAESEPSLRGQRRYDSPAKSVELYEDKEQKVLSPMNCDRPHERYEPCFSGCSAVSCDNPRERLRPCYPFCEPGCICVPPYVRDDRTHKCVMPEECTKGLRGVPDIGDEI